MGIDGQMTLFDFVQSEKDFTKMTLKEIAEEISNATGYEFKEDTSDTWRRGNWYFRKQGIICKIYLSTYAEGCRPKTNHTENGEFIGCSVSFNLGGCSGPMDSLEEAIRFFKRHIPRYLEYVRKEK